MEKERLVTPPRNGANDSTVVTNLGSYVVLFVMLFFQIGSFGDPKTWCEFMLVTMLFSKENRGRNYADFTDMSLFPFNCPFHSTDRILSNSPLLKIQIHDIAKQMPININGG
uniref:hypothetical protein n=1 Tax=Yersinia pestis TaxID=632 RepID=UPI00155D8C32|nr:hypothetical protein [Yersinia pestis]